jgi:NAD(P)-dependent dehydrogenase (short-subunit alcohol dehydrogenase family)
VHEVAVITGTTHGIGGVTSRELARAGYPLMMLCRDTAAGERVRAGILAQIADATIKVIRCDLASLASVRECAAQVRDQCERIGLLVNNAGIASVRHQTSVDGFELTFATNHLGPFLLTALLLDRLASPARVVSVSSRVHYGAPLDLDQVANPARFRARQAYACSKLANVLHTFALARRLAGSGSTANCLHPGVVATNLLPRWLQLIRPLIRRPIFDVERGARTTLHLALAPELAEVSGAYFDENQRPQRADAAAYDVTLQERLWEASSRWVGLAG